MADKLNSCLEKVAAFTGCGGRGSNDSRNAELGTGVDVTRFLDAACMTLFTVLLSCGFLFMFGETLRVVNRTGFARTEYVKRFLNRLFPFRNSFDFNLTHALLFSICVLLLSFRVEAPAAAGASSGAASAGKSR